MVIEHSYSDGNCDFPLASSSLRDVSYSCGACGYALNLSSCNRNTSTISSKYGKSMKKGIISFFSIDESRFTQVDELQCRPYFSSKDSWGLFRRRTKLLCRKCGYHVGNAYKENSSLNSFRTNSSGSSFVNAFAAPGKYDVKIRALQPTSEEFHVPVVR
ncbi:hypothetical protein Syun_003150 [Stephania yunnanensis]|uniref:Uncharacterized protein n=1 Tax=Stephania yunnanensis TaxID=152371 RepID=A0AAP0PZY6_9MAGN